MLSLQNILNTEGQEFIDNLFNKEVVVIEKLNAATLSFKKKHTSEMDLNRKLTFYKGSGVNKKEITIREVESFLKYLKVLTIEGFKVGICFIKYEYRNEVCEYLINNKSDLDCIAMFAFENNQISLRSLEDNSSARIIAEKFGGGGHDNAAAIGLSNDLKDKIVYSVFGDK